MEPSPWFDDSAPVSASSSWFRPETTLRGCAEPLQCTTLLHLFTTPPRDNTPRVLWAPPVHQSPPPTHNAAPRKHSACGQSPSSAPKHLRNSCFISAGNMKRARTATALSSAQFSQQPPACSLRCMWQGSYRLEWAAISSLPKPGDDNYGEDWMLNSVTWWIHFLKKIEYVRNGCVNIWKKCTIFLHVFFALNLIIFMIKNCTKCLSSNNRRFSLHQNALYFILFLVIWWTYVFNWCNYLCIVEEFNRKTANSSHSGDSFCTPPEPAQLWRYIEASIVYPHLHDPYHVVCRTWNIQTNSFLEIMIDKSGLTIIIEWISLIV